MRIVFLTKFDFLPGIESAIFLQGRGHIVDLIIQEPQHIDFSKYDLAISYYYPHLLKKKHFAATRYGTINVHASYLPFNRGVHTNVWAIVDDTPAGITIHWIDQNIDTGNILFQGDVDVLATDTGKTLYNRLSRASYDVFKDFWPGFEKMLDYNNPIPGRKQLNEYATIHYVKDLAKLQNLEEFFGPSCVHLIHEFVDVIRATTFDGYNGSYIIRDGKKVFLKLELHV